MKRRDAALHVGAVADADDIQLARESGRDSLNRIRRQRARQSVQRGFLVARRAAVPGSRPPAQRDAGRNRNGLLALGPFDIICSSPMVIFTPFGSGIGFFPTRDIFSFPYYPNRLIYTAGQLSGDSRQPNAEPYQTWHSTSPPTPSLRADDPVITPRGVVRILIPSPPSTRGTVFRPDVHPAAGTRHALDPRDHRHIARRVFEINADRLLGALFGELVVGDVAFVLQNLARCPSSAAMPARPPWGGARPAHCGCASACRRSDRLSSFLVLHTPARPGSTSSP